MQDPQVVTLTGGAAALIAWEGGSGHVHCSPGASLNALQLQAKTGTGSAWGILESTTGNRSELLPADLANGSGGFGFKAMAARTNIFELRLIDPSQTGPYQVVIGVIEPKK